MEAPEPWWRSRLSEVVPRSQGGLAQVFEGATLGAEARALRSIPGVDRLYFWAPHQPHREVLDVLRRAGCDFAAADVAGLAAIAGHFPRMGAERLRFLPDLAGLDAYAEALAHGAPLSLRAAHPLHAWPELFAGHEITLQLAVAGAAPGAGVAQAELPALAQRVAALGLRITGLQIASPADVGASQHWPEPIAQLALARRLFPEVQTVVLDGRGGLSAGELADPALAPTLRASLALRIAQVRAGVGAPQLHLLLDADLVGSGIALARVLQRSHGDGPTWVACDADFEAAPALAAGASIAVETNETKGDFWLAAVATLLDRRGRAGGPGPDVPEGACLIWTGQGGRLGVEPQVI